MTQERFIRLVLGALYIIMMKQMGYRMDDKFAVWNGDYNEFLKQGEIK